MRTFTVFAILALLILSAGFLRRSSVTLTAEQAVQSSAPQFFEGETQPRYYVVAQGQHLVVNRAVAVGDTLRVRFTENPENRKWQRQGYEFVLLDFKGGSTP